MGKKQDLATQFEMVSGIHSYLVKERAISFEDCIRWSRLRFEEFFNNSIKQLLFNFPHDLITSSGTPFWSGAKKAPNPIEFDPDNQLHMNFIIAAATLRAVSSGLRGHNDVEQIKEVLSDVIVPEFAPKRDVVIPANEQESKKQKESGTDNFDDEEEQRLQRLISELPKPSDLVGFRVTPLEFEKDDDTNFHIDFITSCSNLRAENYAIPTADRHTTKGIAGKIIPAMVTTTAMVTGLVCLELLKIIQKKKVEAYKNSFCNLALPLFTFSEPLPPEKCKIRDGWEWSLWDRFEFQGPKTLGEIIDHFEEEYKLEVTMMSGDSTLLYGFYMPPAKVKERRMMEISQLYTSLTEKPLSSNTITLVCCCTRLEDDGDVEVPSALYRIS